MPKIEQQPSQLGLSEAQFTLEGLECILLRTADGSHSLRYCTDPGKQWTEPMHSSKGAWSETLHVYEPALVHALARTKACTPFAIASIGLGLGYNELLAAAISLQQRRRPEDVLIYSFESEPALRHAFEARFQLGKSMALPQALNAAYDEILHRISVHTAISEADLLAYVHSLFALKNFQLLGAIDTSALRNLSLTEERCGCILFDAFSPESSPDLWDEELLTQMVTSLCARTCIFASYASRTGLKKILRAQGFKLEKVGGFAGKRERTFASRESSELR
jgi:tRNA U34 5-methylaminomethyl-2-thiouridine-forming methyltransferase MnmC